MEKNMRFQKYPDSCGRGLKNRKEGENLWSKRKKRDLDLNG